MSSTDWLPLAAKKRATAWSAFLRKLLTVSLTIRAGIRHQGSKKTKANARREAPVRRASTQQAIGMEKSKKPAPIRDATRARLVLHACLADLTGCERGASMLQRAEGCCCWSVS